MFDDRLEEELRHALERPALASPQPGQARFRSARRASGSRGWIGMAAAFSAGAVATALVVAAGTGSASPRVWTLRAASVVTQLVGGTAPSPQASPSPSPTLAPVVIVTPSQPTPPRSPEPSPEPTERPGDVESGGGGVPDSGDVPEDLSPSPTASPSPSPSGAPSPGSDG